MKPNPELKKFLTPYDKGIQELALELRDFVTDLIPEANELIWDNYNAVAMAYSKSGQLKDAFCHIAVYPKHVNFGFNRGAELTISKVKLKGKGKLIRHISVKKMKSFPKSDMAKMIFEAVEISEKRNENLSDNKTPPKSMIMSISEKKLRPTSD